MNDALGAGSPVAPAASAPEPHALPWPRAFLPPQGLPHPESPSPRLVRSGLHRCAFGIITSPSGDPVPRPVASVLYDAKRLVQAGVK